MAANTTNAQENIQWYKGEDLFDLAWIGASFSPSDPKYAEKMAQIKRVFQEHNVLQELADNWRDGLISEPFAWQLKDRQGKRVEASEAEIELQRWIDWVNQQALEIDPKATNFQQSDPWAEFVLSIGVCGEGNLRLWQPDRYAEADDPIHRIHLHAPKAGSVEVERDKDGFIEKVTYTYGDGQREVLTQDEQGNLVVTSSDAEVEPLTIPTERRWTVQQVHKPSILSQGAKRKQSSICHALTMKLRNQDIGGFKERTLINAEFPQDEAGNPIEVERGPGIDTYIYGIQQGDAMNPSYATPSIHESQPVPVHTFIESIQIDRTLLYHEFRQGHLLAAGDGGLSGESRIQMRQAFELYLRGWKRPIESAIANVLNIVLRILGYTNLEAVVELRITTGKLSAEEKAGVMGEFQAGLLSRATAISKLGTVTDPDAELALIDEELKQMAERQQLNDPFGLGETDEEEEAGAGEGTDDEAGSEQPPAAA